MKITKKAKIFIYTMKNEVEQCFNRNRSNNMKNRQNEKCKQSKNELRVNAFLIVTDNLLCIY